MGDLRLDGAPNFRDLGGRRAGGRRVRSRRLYRSGELSGLSDSDVEALADHGPLVVIDLRADNEVAKAPDRLPAGTEVRHHPIHDAAFDRDLLAESIMAGDLSRLGPDVMVRGYRTFVSGYGEQFAAVVDEVLRAGDRTVILHCTLGKDRAGIASASLLWALGADDETVMEDYLATNDRTEVQRAAWTTTVSEAVGDGDISPFVALIEARRSYLDAAVDEMRQAHETVDRWLREVLGMGDAVRERLRDRLVH